MEKSRGTKSSGEIFRSQQNQSWIQNPRVGYTLERLSLQRRRKRLSKTRTWRGGGGDLPAFGKQRPLGGSGEGGGV